MQYYCIKQGSRIITKREVLGLDDDSILLFEYYRQAENVLHKRFDNSPSLKVVKFYKDPEVVIQMKQKLIQKVLVDGRRAMYKVLEV